jgi:hypothetical protein
MEAMMTPDEPKIEPKVPVMHFLKYRKWDYDWAACGQGSGLPITDDRSCVTCANCKKTLVFREAK